MASEQEQPNVNYGTVLRDVWDNANTSNADEDCSPTKVCRNARDFTFEGIAEDPDEDLASAWKKVLKREGKLAEGGSLGDLVRDQTPQD